MPTYDYQCSGCGQAFEVFQRMSDEPVSSCPDCGAPARRRISGGSGFIFKGEGFYITDHRSQDYKDKAAADAGKEPAQADSGKETARSAGAKASGGDSAGSTKKSEAKTAAAASPDSGTKTSAVDWGGSASGSGAGRRTKAGSER